MHKQYLDYLKSSVKSEFNKAPTWGWIAVAMIWIAIIYALTVPAQATSELEFGAILERTQEEYRDLYLLQKSIAICEGYYHEGSLARRNNNPGNIKSGALRDAQGHGKFPTATEGHIRHLELLQRRYWGHTPKYMNHVLGYATDQNWYNCVDYYYNDPANELLK